MPRGGPLPKDPDQRARRNRASTAATLEAPAPDFRAPSLPRSLFGGSAPAPAVRRWWRVIWRSPMAPRWLEADIEGLYLVAILRQAFTTKPTATLAAEIRNQEARFGLDVISRRRLDWRIAGPRQAPAAPESAPEPPDDAEYDTRRLLRAVPA